MTPKPRRLVIKDVDDGDLASLDLTGMFNANTLAPLLAVVEEQCDMLHWHQIGKVPLPCWGPDARLCADRGAAR